MRHGTFLKDLFETNPMQPELAFYLVGKVRLLGVHCDPKLGSRGAQRGHDTGRGVSVVARVLGHKHTHVRLDSVGHSSGQISRASVPKFNSTLKDRVVTYLLTHHVEMFSSAT